MVAFFVQLMCTLHHELGLGWVLTILTQLSLGWVFFELGQNGLGLGWVWVGFNPVKLLKIHYKDCHYAASWVGVFPGKPY